MARKSKQQQQPTSRSARIQARTTASANASVQNITTITKLDHSRRNLTSTRKISTLTLNKRKHERVSEEEDTTLHDTTVGHKRVKKISAATNSRNVISQQDSSIQEIQAVSSAVIQDIVVPQDTTQRPKKLSKATLSVVMPAANSKLPIPTNSYKEDRSQSKRRKGDTFTVPIPTRPKRVGQVYAIGSNDMSQCGMAKDYEIQKISIVPLEQFNLVDISAGALHSAALTFDGKVVTWGCNDHGKLIIYCYTFIIILIT